MVGDIDRGGVFAQLYGTVAQLGRPDLVILPGTADRPGDMEWLRKSGLEEAIRKRAPVLEAGSPGIFDSGEEVEKLADCLLERKGLEPMHYRPQPRREYQEEQFDLLARTVRENLDLLAVYQAMEEYKRGPSR